MRCDGRPTYGEANLLEEAFEKRAAPVLIGE
jgi:hypothetical protein